MFHCFFFKDPPPPELVHRGHRNTGFYGDILFLVPVVALTSGLIFTLVLTILCYKYRQNKRARKESIENQQNNDAQRERYYATIHKVALQAGNDKIPGTA